MSTYEETINLNMQTESTSSSLPGQLVHHVFFWLKNSATEADQADLLQGIRELKSIPGVRAVHAGVPASTEKREVVDNSFQVSEILFFDNVESQNAYQAHPLHQAFIDKYSHLWENVRVYDALEA